VISAIAKLDDGIHDLDVRFERDDLTLATDEGRQ
jgi:hypothetical protein